MGRIITGAAAVGTGLILSVSVYHLFYAPVCHYSLMPNLDHYLAADETFWDIDKTKSDKETKKTIYFSKESDAPIKQFDVYSVNKIPYAFYIHSNNLSRPYGCVDTGDGKFSKPFSRINWLRIPTEYY